MNRCPYCHRSDILSAEEQGEFFYRSVTIDDDSPPIRFSTTNMCIDCANVASHFLRSGLIAFRKSLLSYASGQLDLFEKDSRSPSERFISNR
jgi:hypothetical protein